ncbi:MAG TPA: tetratricopeptide repeat protein, partial [Bryobacteraceae bacterium]|nr:tetratricopeptide repeat protein [Bryobacteraceae bacterium]
HNKALPPLETLVLETPNSSDSHAELAATYATSSNREGAEKEFRRALELQPHHFPALAGLGNLLARTGDGTAAMPLLRKATQLQPRAYEGHFLLGSALNRSGQFEEARVELETGVKAWGRERTAGFLSTRARLGRAWQVGGTQGGARKIF